MHNNLGIVFQELDQLDAAVKSFEKAISINPDFAEAHNNLGNVLKELGQLDASIKSFEKTLAIKPDYAIAHFNLGSMKRYTAVIHRLLKCNHFSLRVTSVNQTEHIYTLLWLK